MKHTEFGHSISFVAQNWDKYPDFTATDYATIGNYNSDANTAISSRLHLDKNTWESWHLIPGSRPTLPLPKQKTKIIDGIPNTNGQMDLSLKEVPYPLFENREGTFSFIYNPIYSYAYGDYKDWVTLKTEISEFLHGRELRMILEDDPGYYWQGRFSLESWESNNDGSGSTVTIGYSVYPYKRSICSTIQEWLWDPFNFYNGVVPKVFNDIAITTLVNGDRDWTGFVPPNSKNSIQDGDQRWGPVIEIGQEVVKKIDLYKKVGTEPVIPVIWWKPNHIENHHDLLIVDYVNDSYGINYSNLGALPIEASTQQAETPEKYKYYDPKNTYNKPTVSMVKERILSDYWYKFTDKDMIFCDAFMGEAQYIRFIGDGEIKIEFRRGSL